jgi:hypothetical protein
MSSFYQSVIGLISRPCAERLDEHIDAILPWFMSFFKRKSTVFGEIDADVVRDMIKNCSFETRQRDQVIIRQGDVGDV